MKYDRPRIVYDLMHPQTDLVVYVGITADVSTRLRLHVTHPNNDRMRAWIETLNGVPPKMVGLEMLNSSDNAVLSAAEQKWIQHYRNLGVDLFNVEGGGYSGHKLAPESRRKMSEAKLGTKQSPEHIAARVAPRLGRPLTEEHRQNISQAREGWNPSEETRARMSAAKKGKPGRKLTPEDIARLNASRQTPEWREKIRVANTGQKRSPETREKIRLAKLGKKLGPRVKPALSQ